MAYTDLLVGKVTGLGFVTITNRQNVTEDRLFEVGQRVMSRHREQIESRGWVVTQGDAVSKSAADCAEHLYVVEITTRIESVDDAANAICELHERPFEYEV